MKTKIYLVTNIDFNPLKVYIGKTKNSRKNNHELTFGKQITYDYIDEVDSLDYKDYGPIESYWIEQFRQWGFEVINSNEGGGGPSKWSDELLNSEENKLRKEKISNNKERAKKISKSTKGVPLTEERKAKLRGPRPHLVGKKKKGWSDEDKAKQSIVLKGRAAPWMKGKKLTEEQKQNLSEKMKGRPGPMLGKKRPDLKGKPSLNIKPVVQYNLDGVFIKEWSSATEASKFLNIKHSVCISRCCQGKNKTAHGYKWKFKE